MGTYVEALAFEQDIHALPWIHLILHCTPRHLLPRLSPEEFDTGVTVFTVGKENEDPQLAPRSIYNGLPRRFPLLSSVQPSIHLKDMTFQQFKDILPLVSQIPAASVRCQSIRWLDAETLDTPMSPPRSTRGKRLAPHIIEVCDDVVAWPFIWMLVTTNTPQRLSRSPEGNRPIYVVQSELCTMAALIKCLFDECGCIICTSRGVTARQRRKDFTMWSLGSRSKNPNFRSYSRYIDSSLQLADLNNATVIVQNSVELVQESASHQVTIQIAEHGFVTHLELILYDQSKEGHFSHPPDELKIDWDAIDMLVSQLAAPNPPQLEVRVDTNSVADMRAVAPYLRAQMPRLQSAGRLTMTSQQRHVWTTWKQELEKIENGDKPAGTHTPAEK